MLPSLVTPQLQDMDGKLEFPQRDGRNFGSRVEFDQLHSPDHLGSNLAQPQPE